MLLSVAAHELGHILLLCLFGIPIYSLRFGLGEAQLHTPPMSYSRELAVSLAGPAMNLILFLLFAAAKPMLAFVNLILLCYNLLPFYPLDGGRILRALLRLLLPLGAADWVERICTIICAGSITLVAGYLSFSLRVGIWPLLFCGILFAGVGKTRYSDFSEINP